MAGFEGGKTFSELEYYINQSVIRVINVTLEPDFIKILQTITLFASGTRI